MPSSSQSWCHPIDWVQPLWALHPPRTRARAIGRTRPSAAAPQYPQSWLNATLAGSSRSPGQHPEPHGPGSGPASSSITRAPARTSRWVTTVPAVPPPTTITSAVRSTAIDQPHDLDHKVGKRSSGAVEVVVQRRVVDRDIHPREQARRGQGSDQCRDLLYREPSREPPV